MEGYGPPNMLIIRTGTTQRLHNIPSQSLNPNTSRDKGQALSVTAGRSWLLNQYEVISCLISFQTPSQMSLYSLFPHSPRFLFWFLLTFKYVLLYHLGPRICTSSY